LTVPKYFLKIYESLTHRSLDHTFKLQVCVSCLSNTMKLYFSRLIPLKIIWY